MEISGRDCVTCHRTEYDATTNPPHAGLFPTTCADCHAVSTWTPALGGGRGDTNDPAHDIVVDALIPRYSATSIASVTPERETLTMPMRHTSPAIDKRAMEKCSNCHAAQGSLFPGVFHASLATLGIPQPSTCNDCHTPATLPTGFVGPLATDPARTPATGEMKHDAVLWMNNMPSATAAVPQDCATCHVPPSGDHPGASWSTRQDGASPAQFHASLERSKIAQPASCLDCHANSRPGQPIDSSNSSLPKGLVFDHASNDGMNDCQSCHTSTTTWTGGQFHHMGDPTPTSCTSCHEGERPTSDAGWKSATYKRAPFDYGTNAFGITHGAGQDCVGCHTGPSTGGTQTWEGGRFDHNPSGMAGSRCVTCHASQRPDLVLGAAQAASLLPNAFDHAKNGTGDCFGCHQASVAAGTFSNYFNASGTLPGGDWKNGTEYPGSVVCSTTSHITVSEITLQRSGALNLVTGMTTASTAYYDGMVHTSNAVPAAISPGSSPTAPDRNTCWHCHTSTGTNVDSFSDGKFHTALAMFKTSPTSAVTPLGQPSTCNDCHLQTRPHGIVERSGSPLQPMDHDATFSAPVTIGGVRANGVADLDCSTCHSLAGTNWSDGLFHSRIGSAVPSDCTSCHYPAMADGVHADLTSSTLYSMRHRSTQMTLQECSTCHSAALGRAAMTPAWALWNGGSFHPRVKAQPTACIDCHSVSEPTTTTQGSVTYALSGGATPTNGGQYMTHRSSYVTGRDCAACHASDASSTPAWSKATPFHAPVGTTVTTCQGCHGLTNGGGTTPGTNNNMPSGVTDTSTTTTASASTGVAGKRDQIDHSDVNVTSHDCNFCHTQSGPSTNASIKGREWAQATFHAHFSSGSPLVINTTTGRCSHCHTNLKPTSTYPGYNHANIGTADCSSCHSLPGTGTTSAPNWLGAGGGAPATISVGGFVIPAPPASTPTTQLGIVGLPHPTAAGCATCHGTSSGGRNAIGYDHASTLINSNCSSCHEAGSDLVSPVWNGATSTAAGAGDTRPFTLASVRATYKGDSKTETYPNHFYPVDCHECHTAPTGIATGKTGTAYTTAWAFVHNCRNMTPRTTCVMCHTRTTCE